MKRKTDEDLTTGPIPPGSPLLIEFDPASQWYNAALTIAADWIKQGGNLNYHGNLNYQDKLRIYDWYTCQLGRKSKEKYAAPSMKAADLSIWMLKEWMLMEQALGVLEISDNPSAVARFNDEKAWIEYVLTRIVPTIYLAKPVTLRGMMKGAHSDWANKQLEGAHVGIIGFKVEEISGRWRNFISVRSMRSVGFDSRLHELSLNENLEVTLE